MSFLEPAKETLFILGKTKTLVYGHFWRLLNFEPFWDIWVYFLDFLKDSCFTFFIQKVYKKKSLPTYQPLNILEVLKR